MDTVDERVYGCGGQLLIGDLTVPHGARDRGYRLGHDTGGAPFGAYRGGD